MHNGHVDVAQRAAQIFDELVVAVYDSPPKKLLFSTVERVEMARLALAHIENLSIVSFQGLTVECAHHVDAHVIVRGLRNVADYEFESQIGLANRHMAPDVELCCFLCSTRYVYLSSTIVKEVASLGGDVSEWVAPPIALMLAQHYADRAGQTAAPSSVTKAKGKLAHRG
jgi:pantetheine-phosphate adenylyltransferase